MESSIATYYRHSRDDVRKVRTAARAGEAAIKVLSSAYTARVSEAFWLDSLSGKESLKMTLPNGQEYTSTSAILVNKIDFDNTLAGVSGTVAELEEQYRRQNALLFDIKRNTQAPPPVAPAAVSTEVFKNAFLNMNDDSNKSYFAMVALLQASPELIDEIPELLKQNYSEGNDNASRMMMGVLEYIGSARAQMALCTVLSDDEQQEANRLRAAIALNGVKEPTDDAIAALRAQITVRGDEVNDAVSNTSYLALGSAMGKLYSNASESYSELKYEMDADLYSSEVPKPIILMAVGNTGDESFYDSVKTYMASDDPSIRKAAVEAAGKTDNGEFLGDIQSLLQAEEDTNVRYEAYKAFYTSDEPEVTNFMASSAKTETSPKAREQIVAHLIKNVDNPKSEEVLTELLDDPSALQASERINVRSALRKNKTLIVR